MMKRLISLVAVLCATYAVSAAQSPEFYMDMGDAPKFEGIECNIEEISADDIEVWNVTMTNASKEVFAPVKAGIRLGIDTYMDKYPEWLDKYFPTLLYCNPTHFHGYLQTPAGKMLGIVCTDPVASWSVDYNLAYEEPTGYWFYGHRISSVNIDLLNALPLPEHNPQDRWKLEPGQTMTWKIMLKEIDAPSEYEKHIHEMSGVPMIRMEQTSYTAGQEVSFDVFADKPKIKVTDGNGRKIIVKKKKVGDRWVVRCHLDKPGLYDVEVCSEGYVTDGKLSVRHSWEWIMRNARSAVLKHKQRATSHVESWYGYHTAFLAAKCFPDASIDFILVERFDHQMDMLYGEDCKEPLYYEWRIQNTASTIGMYVDKYEAYGDEEDLMAACRLADWLIRYAQWRDDAYRNKWKTVYTSVIYVAKSILELYEAEYRRAEHLVSSGADASFWTEAARRHYSSAKRAVDQLVASQGNFHTEGEITFEDGMISCSALQMGMLALMQRDDSLRQHYTEAMLTQLENHNCLTQLHVPDARRRGGTMRYWEAQYDVHMMPNMFNSPHGWSAWRAYATYYAYLLTGEEKWLLETWNAVGAFANLIDTRTGELRWAFVLDPYIRARQMHVPVDGIDPDSLDFGNPHPDMYPNRKYIFGEQYVPMVSSWQTRNSQDNDVHEVFKCLGETFLTNAFVVERASGEIQGYNCKVEKKDDILTVTSDEAQITGLHVNLRHDYRIEFNGNRIDANGVRCGFVMSSDAEVKAPSPQVVIFDTDMGNDIDDALALQMLFNYHKRGDICLAGITVSKSNPLAISYVDGICRYNGFDDMPLGYAYDGPNPEPGNYLIPTLEAMADGELILHPERSIDSDIPDAHELLRSLLEKADDASVTLIAVGPLTNIARLLESDGGVELVAKKVSHIYIMSGDFRESKGNTAEWNILQDMESSAVVYSECPVPLTVSGSEVGSGIRYPASSILNDFGDPMKHPLCISYSNFLRMPYDRPAWDLVTVLKAVEPSYALFGSSPKGWVIMDEDGFTSFREDPDGLHDYMTVHPDDRAYIVQKLIDRVTK